MSGRPHLIHGSNVNLCRTPDSVLRSQELKEWAAVREACDRHLEDLIREARRVPLQKHHSRLRNEPKRTNSNA
jgi:hypothetical protein